MNARLKIHHGRYILIAGHGWPWLNGFAANWNYGRKGIGSSLGGSLNSCKSFGRPHIFQIIWRMTIYCLLYNIIISGVHTELILVRSFGDYKLLGATRDDAVGEASISSTFVGFGLSRWTDYRSDCNGRIILMLFSIAATGNLQKA